MAEDRSSKGRPVAATEPPPSSNWVGPDFSGSASMVTFIVGSEGKEKTFLVHKEHACHWSPILKAAFNGQLLEGQTQTYRLDDITLTVFLLFVQWLYSQKFKILYLGNPGNDGDGAPPAFENQHTEFVQLWILADRFLIPRLQNQVMMEIERAFKVQITTTWIPHAYAGTSPDSPLRHLAVDICLYDISSGWVKKHPEQLPVEMLLDLAERVVLSKGSVADTYIHRRKRYDYYVKEDTTEEA